MRQRSPSVSVETLNEVIYIPRSIENSPMTVLDHTLLIRFVDIGFNMSSICVCCQKSFI